LRDASDLALALVALDAIVHIQGTAGTRSVPLTEFYLLLGDRPDLENVLQHGELITEVEIPWLPAGARSTYLKVRDPASYEFALASAGWRWCWRTSVLRRTARVGRTRSRLIVRPMSLGFLQSRGP
jgi:CO/xanthine dehydrogenase FAD-binding subunit